jgi:hypothetical protein
MSENINSIIIQSILESTIDPELIDQSDKIVEYIKLLEDKNELANRIIQGLSTENNNLNIRIKAQEKDINSLVNRLRYSKKISIFEKIKRICVGGYD